LGGGGIAFQRSGWSPLLLSSKGTAYVSYEGYVVLHVVTISPELAVRILPWWSRVSPYVVYRPRIVFARTIIRTSVGGVDTGRVEEWKWLLTAEGGAGVEIAAGAGRFFVEVVAGWFPLSNGTVGNATSFSLGISFGYRCKFDVRKEGLSH
jgi:hypothetical protein